MPEMHAPWIDDLIQEYYSYYGKDRSRSLQSAQTIYDKSLAADYKRGIALGLLFLGAEDRIACSYADSERRILEAVAISREACDARDRIRILQGLGTLYTDTRQKDKAILALEEAVHLAHQSNEVIAEAKTHLMLANIFLVTDDADEAISHSRQALTLFSELQDEQGIAFSFANLGNAYLMKNEPRKSLEYCKTALNYFIEMHTPYNIAALKSNLGDVYIQLGDYHQALMYLDSALSRIGEDVYPYLMCSIHCAKFEAYYRQGETESAERELRNAYKIAGDVHSTSLLENCRYRESLVKAKAA